MYDEPDDIDEPQPSPQAKGSVKVSASLIEYDAERMFDAIVRTAAHAIVEQARGGIREAVMGEVRIAIRSSVGAIIEKTVNESIQQRNSRLTRKTSAKKLPSPGHFCVPHGTKATELLL